MAAVFENKIAWITGGGSGIGRALAIELAKRGTTVIVSGRRKKNLENVVSEINDMNRQGLALACDVTDEASLEKAIEEIISTFGKLDIAVANAGYAVTGPFERLSLQDWRRQLDVNVLGLVATAQAALPELRKSEGRLVLVGSIAGFVSAPNSSPYHASKYAVRAIAQSLSMELNGSGVSCTHLAPGYVDSEIYEIANDGSQIDAQKVRKPTKLMWTSERAAKVMANAIAARKREHIFTGHGKAAAFFGQHTPGLVHFFAKKRRKKKRKK